MSAVLSKTKNRDWEKVKRKKKLTNIGDEASLQNTQERTAGQEGRPPAQPKLGSRHDAPQGHLRRDPAVRAHPL